MSTKYLDCEENKEDSSDLSDNQNNSDIISPPTDFTAVQIVRSDLVRRSKTSEVDV